MLVGSTFLSADSILICKEARVAVAVVGGWVKGRVYGAGYTISLTDKVVGRAGLALAVHETVSGVALTGSSLSIVN